MQPVGMTRVQYLAFWVRSAGQMLSAPLAERKSSDQTHKKNNASTIKFHTVEMFLLQSSWTQQSFHDAMYLLQ